MRKTALLVIILFSLVTQRLVAQEGLPFYSHYLVTDKYLINPSYAGTNPEVLSVAVTHRNQWDDLSESPSTQTLSVHGTVWDRLALGAYVFRDRNGLTSLTGVNLSAAYHIPIGEQTYYYEDAPENLFSFGLAVNNFTQKFDLDKIVVNDPNDPLLVDDTYNLNYINLGLSFQYEGFSGGLSVLDIPLQGNQAIVNEVEPLPTWYYIMAGYRWQIFEGFNLEPSVLLNLNSNSERHLDLNLIGHFGFGEGDQGVDLGVSYRQDLDRNGGEALSVSPLMKLKIGQLKAGVSYDIGLSDMTVNGRKNGLLFSLGYDFGNPFNPDFR